MAIAPDSENGFSLPPDDVPLGIQKPLGLSMDVGQGWLQPKFLTPLGTRSLTILDPTIFQAQESTSDWQSPFEDSPFFDPPETSVSQSLPAPTTSTIPTPQPVAPEAAIASADEVSPQASPLLKDAGNSPTGDQEPIQPPAIQPVVQPANPAIARSILEPSLFQPQSFAGELTAESAEPSSYSGTPVSSNGLDASATHKFSDSESLPTEATLARTPTSEDSQPPGHTELSQSTAETPRSESSKSIELASETVTNSTVTEATQSSNSPLSLKSDLPSSSADPVIQPIADQSQAAIAPAAINLSPQPDPLEILPSSNIELPEANAETPRSASIESNSPTATELHQSSGSLSPNPALASSPADPIIQPITDQSQAAIAPTVINLSPQPDLIEEALPSGSVESSNSIPEISRLGATESSSLTAAELDPSLALPNDSILSSSTLENHSPLPSPQAPQDVVASTIHRSPQAELAGSTAQSSSSSHESTTDQLGEFEQVSQLGTDVFELVPSESTTEQSPQFSIDVVASSQSEVSRSEATIAQTPTNELAQPSDPTPSGIQPELTAIQEVERAPEQAIAQRSDEQLTALPPAIEPTSPPLVQQVGVDQQGEPAIDRSITSSPPPQTESPSPAQPLVEFNSPSVVPATEGETDPIDTTESSELREPESSITQANSLAEAPTTAVEIEPTHPGESLQQRELEPSELSGLDSPTTAQSEPTIPAIAPPTANPVTETISPSIANVSEPAIAPLTDSEAVPSVSPLLESTDQPSFEENSTPAALLAEPVIQQSPEATLFSSTLDIHVSDLRSTPEASSTKSQEVPVEETIPTLSEPQSPVAIASVGESLPQEASEAPPIQLDALSATPTSNDQFVNLDPPETQSPASVADSSSTDSSSTPVKEQAGLTSVESTQQSNFPVPGPIEPAIASSISSENGALISALPLSESVQQDFQEDLSSNSVSSSPELGRQQPVEISFSAPPLAAKVDLSSETIETSPSSLDEIAGFEGTLQPSVGEEQALMSTEEAAIASTEAENAPQAFDPLGNQPSAQSSIVQRAELVTESSVQPSIAAASESSTNIEAAVAESQSTESLLDTEIPASSPETDLRFHPPDQLPIIAPKPSPEISQSPQPTPEIPTIQTALNSDVTSALPQLHDVSQVSDSVAQLSSEVQSEVLAPKLSEPNASDPSVSATPSIEAPPAGPGNHQLIHSSLEPEFVPDNTIESDALVNPEPSNLIETQAPVSSTDTELATQSSPAELQAPTPSPSASQGLESQDQISQQSQSIVETPTIQAALAPDVALEEVQLQGIDQPPDTEAQPIQLQPITPTSSISLVEQQSDSVNLSAQSNQTEQSLASAILPLTEQSSAAKVLPSEGFTASSSDLSPSNDQFGDIQQSLIQTQRDARPELVEMPTSGLIQPKTEPASESIQQAAQETAEPDHEDLVIHNPVAAELTSTASTHPSPAKPATELPELPTVLQPLSVWEPLTQASPLNAATESLLSSPAQLTQSPEVPSIQAQWSDRPSSSSTSTREQNSTSSVDRESAGPTEWANIAELFQSSQSSVEPSPATQSPESAAGEAYSNLNLYPQSDLAVEEILQRFSTPEESPAIPEPSNSNPQTSEASPQSAQPEKAQASPEQLERLAQEIYRLLRQRLALERERAGNSYSGRLL